MSEAIDNKDSKEVPEVKEEVKIPEEIRVGNRTKPKDLIAQCEKLLKDDKAKEINLTAVGSSISDLIIAVEILKSANPGLYQQNIFSTIGPRTASDKDKDKDKEKDKEKDNKEKPQRLYPHLKVVLSFEKIEGKEIPKISEEERKILIDTMDKQKEVIKYQRRFNSFRARRRRRRNFGFRNRRRQMFLNPVRRNNGGGYRNVRNNNRRNVNNMFMRKRPPFMNRNNNRRMFVKSPAGRRLNDTKKTASRKESGNKSPGKS